MPRYTLTLLKKKMNTQADEKGDDGKADFIPGNRIWFEL